MTYDGGHLRIEGANSKPAPDLVGVVDRVTKHFQALWGVRPYVALDISNNGEYDLEVYAPLPDKRSWLAEDNTLDGLLQQVYKELGE